MYAQLLLADPWDAMHGCHLPPLAMSPDEVLALGGPTAPWVNTAGGAVRSGSIRA